MREMARYHPGKPDAAEAGLSRSAVNSTGGCLTWLGPWLRCLLPTWSRAAIGPMEHLIHQPLGAHVLHVQLKRGVTHKGYLQLCCLLGVKMTLDAVVHQS
jgi:hypothetical protein